MTTHNNELVKIKHLEFRAKYPSKKYLHLSLSRADKDDTFCTGTISTHSSLANPCVSKPSGKGSKLAIPKKYP